MRSKLILMFALMLCMGALFFCTATYASDGTEGTAVTEAAVEAEPAYDEAEAADGTEVIIDADVAAEAPVEAEVIVEAGAVIEPASVIEVGLPGEAKSTDGNETLSVDAVWLEGEMLHVEVTDTGTGVNQELELNFLDYANGSEYVSVQAINRSGNKSNTIQFKNPYYEASKPSTSTGQSISVATGNTNGTAFTPDGTGEVVDNVNSGDGKEFFSIKTTDGNVFYLIVDRERNSDNVYLLNTVTENDLTALAEGGGSSVSAIPTPTPTPTVNPVETEAPETGQIPAGNPNTNIYIFILIAALAAGGVAYYIKIVRPKQQEAEMPPEGIDDDEMDEADENDLPDGTEDEEGGER